MSIKLIRYDMGGLKKVTKYSIPGGSISNDYLKSWRFFCVRQHGVLKAAE